MRAPPSTPPAQDCSATGLSLNGTSFMRETQSMAFFNPPGMLQLYSGATMMKPSAGLSPGFGVGRKTRAGLNVVIIDRHLVPGRRRCDRHSRRRQGRQGACQRGVIGAFAQAAADRDHIESIVGHVLVFPS